MNNTDITPTSKFLVFSVSAGSDFTPYLWCGHTGHPMLNPGYELVDVINNLKDIDYSKIQDFPDIVKISELKSRLSKKDFITFMTKLDEYYQY